MNNKMKIVEMLDFIVPPYKTATIHVRSLKFAQIWYFCLLKATIDVANDEVDGMPGNVRHYILGRMIDPLSGCSISIADIIKGGDLMDDIGNVIYLRAKHYFKYYRKIMRLNGPRGIGLGERIFMLQMAYWYRYGIHYLLNIPSDICNNMNTILDKYGARNFDQVFDSTEYVTYDHKVEMYLWNKLIRESTQEYKGITMGDILDPVRENWKVVYDGPEVLESSDAPRKPIPVDYVP